jgi:hypothetical protein
LTGRAAELRREGLECARIAEILNAEGWRPAKRCDPFNAPLVHHLLLRSSAETIKYSRRPPHGLPARLALCVPGQVRRRFGRIAISQVDLKPEEMAQPVRRVEAGRVGFVYSDGWAGGEAAIIGRLNGRDICIGFTRLRETNDGNGGPLAR